MSPAEFWMLVHYRQTQGKPDGPGPVTRSEFEEMIKQDEERQRKAEHAIR